MTEIVFQFCTDTGRLSPEGPGWYIGIYAYGDGEQRPLVSPKRVSSITAAALGEEFENALQGQVQDPEIPPGMAVASGTELIRTAIKKQLNEAEDQAKRIKQLRQLLQTEVSALPPATVPPSPDQE